MARLTMLVGIPSSGKSAVAQAVTKERNGLYISAEAIARELTGEHSLQDRNSAVYTAVEEHLIRAMQEGANVVLDARHRAPKYRQPYLQLARRHGYETEAIFVNLPLEQVLEQGARESVIRKFERHLQIPTPAEDFDRILVHTSEDVLPEARDFFHENEKRLLERPVELIRQLEQDGRLATWLPELHRAIPVDQHNPHHRYTVYEHILKATENVAGTSLKMVWTMLLHDTGKAYPGIKQFTGYLTEDFDRFKRREKVIIENGADIREGRDTGDTYVVQGVRIPKEYVNTTLNGHFYEHENLGAQMAFRVLARLGYPDEFALEVATLIQFHMTMPRDIENEKLSAIRKWFQKVGPCAADLMMVRLADTRGK